MSKYEKGDHLWCVLEYEDTVPFTHHGLYVGNDKVIERCQDGVKVSNLREFSEGNEIHIEEHLLRPFTREQSCKRAYSKVGDKSYNVIFNNCECFVTWCINGIGLSAQVSSVAGFAAMLHPVTRVAGMAVSGTIGSNFISTKVPKKVIKVISENPIMQNDLTQTTAENPVTATVGGAISVLGTGFAIIAAIPGAGPAIGLSALAAAGIGGSYLASKIKKWIHD